MDLVVLTPGKEVFSGQVKKIRVPGSVGRFEVLNGHQPIVASLKEGEVQIETEDGQLLKYNVKKGFIEVLKNDVAILVQGIND